MMTSLQKTKPRRIFGNAIVTFLVLSRFRRPVSLGAMRSVGY
jgi:hypothetical protein